MTNTTSPLWADSVRAARFEQWLDAIAERQKIDPRKVDVASADASFRRYLRVRGLAGHPARMPDYMRPMCLNGTRPAGSCC